MLLFPAILPLRSQNQDYTGCNNQPLRRHNIGHCCSNSKYPQPKLSFRVQNVHLTKCLWICKGYYVRAEPHCNVWFEFYCVHGSLTCTHPCKYIVCQACEFSSKLSYTYTQLSGVSHLPGILAMLCFASPAHAYICAPQNIRYSACTYIIVQCETVIFKQWTHVHWEEFSTDLPIIWLDVAANSRHTECVLFKKVFNFIENFSQFLLMQADEACLYIYIYMYGLLCNVL